MCLGVPMRIVERKNDHHALAESLGVKQVVRIDLLPEIKEGVYGNLKVDHFEG